MVMLSVLLGAGLFVSWVANGLWPLAVQTDPVHARLHLEKASVQFKEFKNRRATETTIVLPRDLPASPVTAANESPDEERPGGSPCP